MEVFKGDRNTYLHKLAGEARRDGATDVELLHELEGVNAADCSPPLEGCEVRAIASSVIEAFPTTGETVSALVSGRRGGKLLAMKNKLFGAGVDPRQALADGGEHVAAADTDHEVDELPPVVEGWRSARLFSLDELVAEMGPEVDLGVIEEWARERYTGPRTFEVSRGIDMSAVAPVHPVLFAGPAGHVYRSADLQHALQVLAGAAETPEEHEALDVPLPEQIALMMASPSPPLRLIALDYEKRERNREPLGLVDDWPERLVAIPPETYAPSEGVLERAGLINLRALSFAGLRAGRIFGQSPYHVDPGGDRTAQALRNALAISSRLADLVGNLANIATLPPSVGTPEQVVATFRAHLTPALGALAEATSVAPPTEPVIVH